MSIIRPPDQDHLNTMFYDAKRIERRHGRLKACVLYGMLSGVLWGLAGLTAFTVIGAIVFGIAAIVFTVLSVVYGFIS